MSARHIIVGMVLWLGLLFFGARWAARPCSLGWHRHDVLRSNHGGPGQE